MPDPTPGIDPLTVPRRLLASGAQMPAIGLGTFGSDAVTGEAIAAAVLDAGRLGYRHFDCAAVYSNEHLVGPALKILMGEGVKREALWITSKLWNDKHGVGDVVPALHKSLRDLQLDYLDLFLIHWPFPNFHPPGCDANYHDPDARSYIHENYMRTWRQLETLVDQGLVRHIGTSNMTKPKLELLLRDARIRPVCNEMELHPHFQQPELFAYVRQNGLQAIAYCPLGSPGRPERDRTPQDTAPTPEVGCAARPGTDSVLRQTAQLSFEFTRGGAGSAQRCPDGSDWETGSQLPAHQRPGFLLEEKSALGRSVGYQRRNYPRIEKSKKA
jgi:alcohol dehydrogenase (NADP+)